MTDADDPFADLEADLEGESPDPTANPQMTSQDGRADNSRSDQQSPEHRAQDLNIPAFSFDDTKQDALYARQATWDVFNDTLLEIELALRDYEIRDVPKRELHDAALRVLADHTDELVEAIVAARQEPTP